jgi:hypothetical protein
MPQLERQRAPSAAHLKLPHDPVIGAHVPWASQVLIAL